MGQKSREGGTQPGPAGGTVPGQDGEGTLPGGSTQVGSPHPWPGQDRGVPR